MVGRIQDGAEESGGTLGTPVLRVGREVEFGETQGMRPWKPQQEAEGWGGQGTGSGFGGVPAQ